MTREELKNKIEDDNYGLYDVDGKWLFEMRPGFDKQIFYLMNPKRPIPNFRHHFTVGIEVPINSSDEFILDKVAIAKQDYSKYAHEVDLDGGDLGLPSL